MKNLIESLALEGTALTVALAPALPVDARTLTAATAIRVFDRYPVIDRVIMVTGANKISLSREQVERLLRSETLAKPDGSQWRHAVARIAALLGG
jgi:hypothetical protein